MGARMSGIDSNEKKRFTYLDIEKDTRDVRPRMRGYLTFF